MITFLIICLIAIVAIIALICGAIVELFWPIVAVVAAYYLIKWLNNSSPDKKSGDK